MANMSGAADGLDDDEAPPPVMLQGKSLGWLHARTVKVVTTAGVAVAICHSWQSMPQPACPPRAPPVERPRGRFPILASAHYGPPCHAMPCTCRYKRGQKKKNWKRRWCALRAGCLCYFTDESCKELKGSLDLRGCEVRRRRVTARPPWPSIRFLDRVCLPARGSAQ